MKRWVKPARLRRRMADRRGFSLTELMAALLVLGMLTSLMAGGAMVVKNAYERMTLRTTAQLVLSTAVTAVTEELRWAADAPQSQPDSQDQQAVSFYSVRWKGQVLLENRSPTIWLVAGDQAAPLLTAQTLGQGMQVQLALCERSGAGFSCRVDVTVDDSVWESQEFWVLPVNS